MALERSAALSIDLHISVDALRLFVDQPDPGFHLALQRLQRAINEFHIGGTIGTNLRLVHQIITSAEFAQVPSFSMGIALVAEASGWCQGTFTTDMLDKQSAAQAGGTQHPRVVLAVEEDPVDVLDAPFAPDQTGYAPTSSVTEHGEAPTGELSSTDSTLCGGNPVAG